MNASMANWLCKVADLRGRYEHHCHEIGTEPLSAKALTTRLTSEYPVRRDQARRTPQLSHVDLTASGGHRVKRVAGCRLRGNSHFLRRRA
jgi:hypothetical protein